MTQFKLTGFRLNDLLKKHLRKRYYICSLKKRVGKVRVASTLWAMQRSRKDVADFLQSNLCRTDISLLVIDFSRFARRRTFS